MTFEQIEAAAIAADMAIREADRVLGEAISNGEAEIAMMAWKSRKGIRESHEAFRKATEARMVERLRDAEIEMDGIRYYASHRSEWKCFKQNQLVQDLYKSGGIENVVSSLKANALSIAKCREIMADAVEEYFKCDTRDGEDKMIVNERPAR